MQRRSGQQINLKYPMNLHSDMHAVAQRVLSPRDYEMLTHAHAQTRRLSLPQKNPSSSMSSSIFNLDIEARPEDVEEKDID